jgi:hypothetical protein
MLRQLKGMLPEGLATGVHAHGGFKGYQHFAFDILGLRLRAPCRND